MPIYEHKLLVYHYWYKHIKYHSVGINWLYMYFLILMYVLYCDINVNNIRSSVYQYVNQAIILHSNPHMYSYLTFIKLTYLSIPFLVWFHTLTNPFRSVFQHFPFHSLVIDQVTTIVNIGLSCHINVCQSQCNKCSTSSDSTCEIVVNGYASNLNTFLMPI